MYSVLSPDLPRQVARERLAEASAASLAARVVSARRWQRRAEAASARARLARLAIR